MSSVRWLLPVAVLVACVPCLLIPLAAALIAAGAFSGLLGMLGVPWVLAAVVGVALALALVVLRVRRRGAAYCEVPARRS